MSLENFIDIRLGDPVVSLTLNSHALVYGTMMGRLLYHNFYPTFQRVLNEISDEYISGAWLSENNTLFVCIGDLKAIIIDNPGGELYFKDYIQFDKPHTSIICELSQVKLYKDRVLIAQLDSMLASESLIFESAPMYVIGLRDKEQVMVESVKFLPQTVFFDFNGKKLLYLEYKKGFRVLSFYRIDRGCSEVKVLKQDFGKIGFAKIWGKKVVYVHREKVVKVMNRRGKDVGEIGRHTSYIIALSCVKIEKMQDCSSKKISIGGITNDKIDSENKHDCESRSEERYFKKYIISVDLCGNIKIWGDTGLVEEIIIRNLAELTNQYRKAQYFSMGYPYFVTAFGSRIALSTDLGVLIIRSKEFELVSSISQ